MTDPNKWLCEWFSTKSPSLVLSPEDNYFELGAIDSFGVIELIEDIEENFSIRFLQTDFQDRRFTNIKGLSEIIQEK